MNAAFVFLDRKTERDSIDVILGSPLELMAEQIGSTSSDRFLSRSTTTSATRKPTRCREAWAMQVVRATATPPPQKPPANPTTPLPDQQIGDIIGGKASVEDDGVVAVMVTRSQTFVEAGVVLRPRLNVLHKITFQPLEESGSKANCEVDFAMLAGEVNPALTTARAAGFEIHCLYNQQIAIDPNLFFSHTLRSGDPIELARGVRKVLDTIAATRTPDPRCPQP